MEFWCLSKLHQEWDNYYVDQTILHFKTIEEAMKKFNDYVDSYIENLELEEDDYEIDNDEEHAEFKLYIEDMCDVVINVDKIKL